MSMADLPIARVRVLPDYGRGFAFTWEVAGGFNDPGPWQFIVQMAPSPEGDWRDISPILTNVYAWRSTGPFRINKEFVLYFRVLMRTGNTIYPSLPVTPYGDLDRREFLIGKDVMRREVLHSKNLAGVEVDLWSVSTWGPRCDCKDPVTGHVRDSNCKWCLGTGRYPAYFGPQKMMLSFSTDAAHSKVNSNDGTHETRTFEALAIGNPVLKKGDVVVDVGQDKRYVVGVASVVSEVRRIACLQRIGFDEAPLNDPIYRIGNYDAEDEECDE